MPVSLTNTAAAAVALPKLELVHSREDFFKIPVPATTAAYPEFRDIGSKPHLLPGLMTCCANWTFETAVDPFTGSGSVAHLLKVVGKRTVTADFLNFPTVLAAATIANSHQTPDGPAVKKL